MPAKNDSYGSAYLYSEDLLFRQEYRTVHVEIEQVFEPNTLKSADGRTIDKWSLRFKGKDKTLVLCKTNTSIIHHVLGDPPGNDWIGKTVTLQVRIVDAFGDECAAIRVMPPKGCVIRKSLIKRLGRKAEWKGVEVTT